MKITNPAIPLNSIVVVIGANGYIAQETCHKLLEAGYRVRGTVRDLGRNSWLYDLLNTKFPWRFELIEVGDFEAPGAFDDAFRDAFGVIYVSVPIAISPNPDIAITPIVNTVLNSLSIAAAAGIRRFVLNSSSKAVETTVYNEPHTLAKDTFNNAEIAKVREGKELSALTTYSAGRAQTELAFWHWLKTNTGYGKLYPDFVGNCVVPDGNFGRVLEPNKVGTGLATSIGMLMRALRGEKEGVMPFVGYLIDTQDTARLLVAALVLPDIANERIFAFHQHYTWNELRDRVRALYPDRGNLVLGEDFEDLGRDVGDAGALIVRAEEILRQIGQKGFSELDNLLRDYVDSFYLPMLD